MKKIRYEEYPRYGDGVPFVLNIGLKRTLRTNSEEANWHENPEIQICTEGEGWVLLNGEKYPFNKGDIIVANPDRLHYTATDGYLEYSCIIIDNDFLRDSGIDWKKYAVRSRLRDQEIFCAFRKLEEEYKNDSVLRKTKLCVDVLQITIMLFERYAIKVDSCRETEINSLPVKKAIGYIRENIDKKITLNDLSAAVCFDKYALTRIFKKITGKTIVYYINSLRCKNAAVMLANNASVKEAAINCGFENFSYFVKTFRKHMNELPSDYRKRMANR